MTDHNEKERYTYLLDQLTQTYKYSSSALLLFRHVTDFVTTVVQDDKCLRKQSHDNRLHDILCNFSMAYVPIPLEQDLVKHGKLVNSSPVVGEGSNGRVYKSGLFEGNPIVTKTKKKWSNHTIYDIYVNFVVLNSFLLKGELTYHLVPSYGMFLCSTNEDGSEICLPPKKQEHLFLVQKQLQGTTLASQLSTMKLDKFIRIYKELFHILITLEKSPYQLYHTDLHCNNIIISKGDDGHSHPILLDFELCSFTVKDEKNKPHRYRLNSLENKYCGDEHVMSGAHDIILFLAHCSAFNNDEIHDYVMNHLHTLFQPFKKTKHSGFNLTSRSFYSSKDRWIFQILMDAEAKVADKDREEVHRHNIQELKAMTYQEIYNRLGL